MAKRSGDKGDGGRRVQRVEREIREVIATYLVGGFKGELPGIVSVTRVIASKDLRTAKIMVTVMGFEANNKVDTRAAIDALQERVHEVQHEVNRRLQMRHCPKLTFMYDEGFEKALKVEHILRNLAEESKAGARFDKSDEKDDE
jgi:ribosome-binding factor A